LHAVIKFKITQMFRFSTLLWMFLLFGYPLFSLGQTTEALDQKFGFQNFKFNTPLSSYNSYNPVKIEEGRYKLTNIKTVKIGNWEVESIELFFKSDNLVKIIVKVDDTERQKNESIYNALLKNYGRYTYHRSSSGYSYTSEMIWKGKLVNLVYSFSSYREGDIFKSKITLIYSYLGETVEVDLTKDL